MVYDRDHMAVVTFAFSKSSVFAVHINSLAGVFKFVHIGERFHKVPFSVIENAVLEWTEG